MSIWIYRGGSTGGSYNLILIPSATESHRGQESGCHHRAQDVADGRVGVPYPHDEASLALAEPVGHDRDDAWPPRGLEQSSCDGDKDEVPVGVVLPEEGHAKVDCEGTATHQPWVGRREGSCRGGALKGRGHAGEELNNTFTRGRCQGQEDRHLDGMKNRRRRLFCGSPRTPLTDHHARPSLITTHAPHGPAVRKYRRSTLSPRWPAKNIPRA